MCQQVVVDVVVLVVGDITIHTAAVILQAGVSLRRDVAHDGSAA